MGITTTPLPWKLHQTGLNIPTHLVVGSMCSQGTAAGPFDCRDQEGEMPCPLQLRATVVGQGGMVVGKRVPCLPVCVWLPLEEELLYLSEPKSG